MKQSLSEMAFVVALEDVFLSDISEDGDGFVQYNIDFDVGFLTDR
jgi:hypothetical protein